MRSFQCRFKRALTSCKYIYIFIVAINSVIRLAITVQILIVILNGKFTVLLLHLNSMNCTNSKWYIIYVSSQVWLNRVILNVCALMFHRMVNWKICFHTGLLFTTLVWLAWTEHLLRICLRIDTYRYVHVHNDTPILISFNLFETGLYNIFSVVCLFYSLWANRLDFPRKYRFWLITNPRKISQQIQEL